MTKRVSIRQKRQQQQEQEQQHPQQPEGGQGVRNYTGKLKEDKPQSNEPTTKITLRIPISIAQMIDEVFGKKKLRGEVKNKYKFIAELLRPHLEAEKKRLLELDIQELEAKKQQIAILSE